MTVLRFLLKKYFRIFYQIDVWKYEKPKALQQLYSVLLINLLMPCGSHVSCFQICTSKRISLQAALISVHWINIYIQVVQIQWCIYARDIMLTAQVLPRYSVVFSETSLQGNPFCFTLSHHTRMHKQTSAYWEQHMFSPHIEAKVASIAHEQLCN